MQRHPPSKTSSNSFKNIKSGWVRKQLAEDETSCLRDFRELGWRDDVNITTWCHRSLLLWGRGTARSLKAPQRTKYTTQLRKHTTRTNHFYLRCCLSATLQDSHILFCYKNKSTLPPELENFRVCSMRVSNTAYGSFSIEFYLTSAWADALKNRAVASSFCARNLYTL